MEAFKHSPIQHAAPDGRAYVIHCPAASERCPEISVSKSDSLPLVSSVVWLGSHLFYCQVPEKRSDEAGQCFRPGAIRQQLYLSAPSYSASRKMHSKHYCIPTSYSAVGIVGCQDYFHGKLGGLIRCRA